ncbi:acetyl/propionyl/methylcrotonyl-CoA carboxylase subunit alpha [Actinoallomurus rhizosphaericola]|uniref:acetyl/propionyl/methylcrotonyl-CoA carboxylase subunit alpha n=1 Tax=Actinoallomurus rhizosphaericola TaxID=2952536 RepID=UPI00209212E7|nr:biotin carboxylase N-terminal domain-containing protein [Actinoallomurus rhizosphaericola]MCO5996801.1 ATP-grasp domain-containing protein [Actinoallomurus rhizosphaericola]
MISRLLVANRGEIARRVFRTCRDLGITTVAVFSDPDASLPHVGEADLAVRLPGAAPAETYLDGEAIVAAARAAGADAVHPGYGFLSENAAFAEAVIAAGLTWVGPPPAAIAAMGSKIEAKRLMGEAGVPVLPELDPATVSEFPVLVKASAGGGGRGMRIVRAAGDLPGAVEAARREAASAFGDPTVFCEPLLTGARHIEVQVLADSHGTVWTLGERECSIQRRHQKVIEEAPSPAVDAALRERLSEAAAAAARAIGYTGAGTVEFMLTPGGEFFFLEVNTRLQVEHPVTECVYGVDLVALQLEVAEGAALGDPPRPRGHAIEARLYAEDPAEDYRPYSGPLHAFEIPGVDAEFAVPPGHGLRLDAGVVSGSVVSTHYDPMLAKVIAYGPTRAAAVRRLATALAEARIHGLVTNRDQLVTTLRHDAFRAGDTDTGFLDRHPTTAPLAGEKAVRLSALAAALARAVANRRSAPVLRGLPSGWRNVVSQPQRAVFEEAEVAYRLTRDGLAADGHPDVALVSAEPDAVVLDRGGVRLRFAVAWYDRRVHVESVLGPVTLTPVERLPDPAEQIAPGTLLAPMPGSVVRVAVREGDTVERGQPVLWLEAMKMEHQILAPATGVVTALHAEAGRQVETGAVLAVVTEG